MNLRWIVFRCNDCKKLQWFDNEPNFKVCFPCLLALDSKLRKADQEELEKWEKEQ